ncbi:MAG TPA: hypothetical protein VN843_36580 [Anaerolineales bacterium]|nr:hypothetical protein [Anaerolineales bacterium]
MLTADERLALIRSKIERAKKHILDLEIARDRFIETEPYVIEPERDPQTGNHLFRVAKLQLPPPDLGLMAGDAAHNLRSALDHLAYKLVLVNKETPNRNTGFPIFDDAARYVAGSHGKIKLMSQSAQDAIKATEPYRGRNNLLWLINAIDIADKHHTLLVGLIHVGRYSVRGPMFGRFNIPESSPPLKEGDVIFSCEPKVYENVKFTFDVTLKNPEAIAGVPLLPTLHKAANRIDDLILSFKPLLV